MKELERIYNFARRKIYSILKGNPSKGTVVNRTCERKSIINSVKLKEILQNLCVFLFWLIYAKMLGFKHVYPVSLCKAQAESSGLNVAYTTIVVY